MYGSRLWGRGEVVPLLYGSWQEANRRFRRLEPLLEVGLDVPLQGRVVLMVVRRGRMDFLRFEKRRASKNVSVAEGILRSSKIM